MSRHPPTPPIPPAALPITPADQGDAAGRQLTLFASTGLCNRLLVLLSGTILARATGRQLRLLWPITPACGAAFDELFSNPWPVEVVDQEVIEPLPYYRGWFDPLPDLTAVEQPQLVVGFCGWLLLPQRYPHHRPLWAAAHALALELQPIPPLQATIDAFIRDHFRPTMIGVHLRRGDFLQARPDLAGNIGPALAAVDHYLSQWPEAGIFLSSDDGAPEPYSAHQYHRQGVHERFRQRYGERVVWTTPESLDRCAAGAIQAAVVDLWLLRATNCLVGSEGSSFSEFALCGRQRPHRLIAAPLPGYRRWERWAKWSGLHRLLMALGRRHSGRTLPFPVVFEHYLRRVPSLWLRRLAHASCPPCYRLLQRMRRRWWARRAQAER